MEEERKAVQRIASNHKSECETTILHCKKIDKSNLIPYPDKNMHSVHEF